MKALTPGEVWAAVTVLLLIEAAIFCMILRGIAAAAKEAVKEDRRRVRAAAEQTAEQEARRRVREILRNTRFTVPVALVNESDIPWGEEDRK